MKIEEVLDLAKNGDLKNIAVGKDNASIIGFINLGVIELYKRLLLKTEEVIITIGDATQAGGIVNGLQQVTYINDTTYEMPSNFMSIVAAYGEIPVGSADNYNNLIPINEEENNQSILTISYNQIQIPTATTGANVSIIYTASPSMILSTDVLDVDGVVTDGTVNVPIPYYLLEALLYYVGFRGHAGVDASVNQENNSYYMRFDASVKKVKEMGLLTPDDVSTFSRFYTKGFV